MISTGFPANSAGLQCQRDRQAISTVFPANTAGVLRMYSVRGTDKRLVFFPASSSGARTLLGGPQAMHNLSR